MQQKNFPTFQWIDLTSPTAAQLQEISERFGLDANLVEDSLEYGHLPKFERLEKDTFIILRGYSAGEGERVTAVGELSNKIAFFLRPDRLITVHRAPFSFLEKIVDEATSSESLMLDIINGLLSTYEAPLGWQRQTVDRFEKEIFLKNGRAVSIEALYFEKNKARLSKKILQLTQGVLNQLTVQPENASDLQDLKETTISLLLGFEEVVEESNALLNSYLSVTAQKNNDVMKLLTIFSVFFLPLTFIAGIYGMNFENMPELTWEVGYFLTLGVMAVVALVIYLWFKRRRIL